MKATSSSLAIASSRCRRCSRVRLPNGLAVAKSKRNSRNPCSSDSGGISRPSWSITGPRASAAPKFAREVPLGRNLVLLSGMIIRWERTSGAQVASRSRHLLRGRLGRRIRQLADAFVHQPGTEDAGDDADQAIHDELESTGIRSATAIQQRGREKRDHTDQQHTHDRRDAPDMREDVVDRTDHQRRQEAEQIAELQRGEEHLQQLADQRRRQRLAPIARQDGGGQQQPESAEQRTHGDIDQITLHARPLSSERKIIAAACEARTKYCRRATATLVERRYSPQAAKAS